MLNTDYPLRANKGAFLIARRSYKARATGDLIAAGWPIITNPTRRAKNSEHPLTARLSFHKRKMSHVKYGGMKLFACGICYKRAIELIKGTECKMRATPGIEGIFARVVNKLFIASYCIQCKVLAHFLSEDLHVFYATHNYIKYSLIRCIVIHIYVIAGTCFIVPKEIEHLQISKFSRIDILTRWYVLIHTF